MNTLLLIGSTPEVLAAKSVVLEGAGYSVHTLERGASARRVAEEIGASLIVIDVTASGPDVRSALNDLSAPGSPSSVPVLVIGEASAMGEFDGPGEAISKPAEKRSLLDSTRRLIKSQAKPWVKKKT